MACRRLTIRSQRATKTYPGQYVGITMQPDSRARSSSDVHVPRLKEWRTRRLLSQKELADRSGVSRATIIALEKGRDAWPKTARKLVQALRIKPEQLQ